jgi:hypothetical protein
MRREEDSRDRARRRCLRVAVDCQSRFDNHHAKGRIDFWPDALDHTIHRDRCRTAHQDWQADCDT